MEFTGKASRVITNDDEKKKAIVKECSKKYPYTLFVFIYHNKQIGYNVVHNEDVISNIEYNITFRPGRLYYMVCEDDTIVRINNGMIKEEYLSEYDKQAIDFVNNSKINIGRSTRPYI